MQRILLIIPAYNEGKNILNTINKINDSRSDIDYIIINDGSSDDTEKICIKNNFNYISLIQNLGIGGAVQTGYKYALDNNYDIAIQFDGDGQHDIKYIKALIKPIVEDNSDLVIGSRFIEGKSSFKSTKTRQIGIKVISVFIKLFTKRTILDTTSGFRACNRKVIQKFAHNYPTEYPEPVTTVELLKSKYKVSEIPVEMKEREAGRSSIRAWKSVYYMINVILSIIIVSIRKSDN